MPIILETGALASITANDIIERSYRLLGDLGTGESMTAAQGADGLEALNAMLDLFSIERLMIYEVRQESFTWPASTVSRTIGSGGDFDTHRPNRVEVGSFFRDSNNIDYPVKVVYDRSTYDGIEDKTVESSFPEVLFYNPSVTVGTIYLYPIPNQSLTFYLNQWQPLQVFDSLSEAHAMPPGYRQMLSYNLAETMEGEVGLPLPEGVRKIAMTSKAAVKRNNYLPVNAQTETAYVLHGRGRSDIEAGTP